MRIAKHVKGAPLAGTRFGAVLTITGRTPAARISQALEAGPEIVAAFHQAGGLIVVRGLDGISTDPQALVTLSHLFGPEVENVRETLTQPRFFHPDEALIMLLANRPPCAHPPPPAPPRLADGSLDIRHPAQTNWHTDQSYRRPPPDVTLLYGVVCPPPDQGQTLYADATAAFAALDDGEQARLRGLDVLHAARFIRRAPQDVRAGVEPKPLLPHQRPQLQPLVRNHPVTGRPALYLSQPEQLDYVEGPIPGLGTGPDSEGAALVEKLLCHITQPEFVYTHHWQPGDLVIGDNRCLLHCATWYDADTHAREMWRTTVMGNPGAPYAGEAKSWVPEAGHGVMEGMEDA